MFLNVADYLTSEKITEPQCDLAYLCPNQSINAELDFSDNPPTFNTFTAQKLPNFK